jgi:hypothetical protein
MQPNPLVIELGSLSMSKKKSSQNTSMFILYTVVLCSELIL